MRMNKSAPPVPSFRPWLTILLTVVLAFSSFVGLAYAEDAITGIAFDNAPSPARIYMDDDSLQVDVVASISGSSSLKNVTTDAAWTSSNTSIVKVSSGLLTAIAKGSATVSATYKGFKVSLPVTVDYLYDSVTIKTNGTSVGDTVNVKLGEEIAYELIASKSGSADQTVTGNARWTSSNTDVATVDNGKIKLLAAGETTVTAKYKGRSDTVKLNVTSPYKSLSFGLPDDQKDLVEFTFGDATKKLTATSISTEGSSSDVTDSAAWTSSSTSVVTVNKGILTPTGVGTATVKADYLGVSNSITVVVRPAFEAMRITPKDEQHLLLQDNPVPFTANVLKGNADPENVTLKATWTSSNVFTATVDKYGVVTPKGIGTTVIKASYMGVSQQVNVMVYPTVASLTAAKDTLDVFLDDTVTLPKISATSISDETVDVTSLVSWSTSDATIFDKIDGKWKAKRVGTVILTGSIQSKTVLVTVNVHEQPLLLTADQANASVVIGKDTKLPIITMTYDSGTEEDVTSRVTWKSSSANLIVKAPNMKGIQASSVTLTASYLGKSTTVRVTIEEELTKLVVDSDSPSVFTPGRSFTVKVTGVYKSGKTVALASKLNWTMDPEDLATMKGASLKTLREGTGKLTGTYQGKSVVIPVSVIGKLKKLTPSVKSLTVQPEAKASIKLTGEFEGGRLTDMTRNAAWTTGNDKVAVVDNGVVTGIAKGSTNIKATVEGKSVTIRVVVK